RRALRAWPLPTLRDAEPHHLGVFPASRGYGGSGGAMDHYVRRSPDDDVEQAVASSFFVLLYGPRLVGKSRTALEAARRALPDAVVAAPDNGDALVELFEPDSPLRSESRQVVLWLDGLERFVDALDRPALDELRDMECGVTVVATVRTDDWEELLRVGGQPGEGAKAVAARARAFELEQDLDPRERGVAEALFPDADLRDGIGPAVATSGKE